MSRRTSVLLQPIKSISAVVYCYAYGAENMG